MDAFERRRSIPLRHKSVVESGAARMVTAVQNGIRSQLQNGPAPNLVMDNVHSVQSMDRRRDEIGRAASRLNVIGRGKSSSFDTVAGGELLGSV